MFSFSTPSNRIIRKSTSACSTKCQNRQLAKDQKPEAARNGAANLDQPWGGASCRRRRRRRWAPGFPHRDDRSTIFSRARYPATCPADAGSPLALAQLEFPSIITATCLGSDPAFNGDGKEASYFLCFCCSSSSLAAAASAGSAPTGEALSKGEPREVWEVETKESFVIFLPLLLTRRRGGRVEENCFTADVK